MEKYTFKLKDVEEEFFPIEVSKDMRQFLEEVKDKTISGETEEYEIHHADSIREVLQECADFETSVSDGVMGEYGSLHHLFIEYDEVVNKGFEFVGIKK